MIIDMVLLCAYSMMFLLPWLALQMVGLFILRQQLVQKTAHMYALFRSMALVGGLTMASTSLTAMLLFYMLQSVLLHVQAFFALFLVMLLVIGTAMLSYEVQRSFVKIIKRQWYCVHGTIWAVSIIYAVFLLWLA